MPGRKAWLAWSLGLLALLGAGGVRAETMVAALDWQRPAPNPFERELECLALNIYWEARSELLLGQMAVAAVTLNRVAAPAFPNSVCAVVFQGEERGRHLCQFSWRCDGRADLPHNLAAWREARRVAELALRHQVDDPTGGALWYHADHVLPAWTNEMKLRARIGHHLFYDRPNDAVFAHRPATGGVGARASAAEFGSLGCSTSAAAAGPEACGEVASAVAIVTAFKGPATQLKIDVAADPTAGLLLCADENGCDGNETSPPVAAEPLLCEVQLPEPAFGHGGTRGAPASVTASVLNRALLDRATGRLERALRDRWPGLVVMTRAALRSGQYLNAGGIWQEERPGPFDPPSAQAGGRLAAWSEPMPGWMQMLARLQAFPARLPDAAMPGVATRALPAQRISARGSDGAPDLDLAPAIREMLDQLAGTPPALPG